MIEAIGINIPNFCAPGSCDSQRKKKLCRSFSVNFVFMQMMMCCGWLCSTSSWPAPYEGRTADCRSYGKNYSRVSFIWGLLPQAELKVNDSTANSKQPPLCNIRVLCKKKVLNVDFNDESQIRTFPERWMRPLWLSPVTWFSVIPAADWWWICSS